VVVVVEMHLLAREGNDHNVVSTERAATVGMVAVVEVHLLAREGNDHNVVLTERAATVGRKGGGGIGGGGGGGSAPVSERGEPRQPKRPRRSAGGGGGGGVLRCKQPNPTHTLVLLVRCTYVQKGHAAGQQGGGGGTALQTAQSTLPYVAAGPGLTGMVSRIGGGSAVRRGV
jgi:hypothetical protein